MYTIKYSDGSTATGDLFFSVVDDVNLRTNGLSYEIYEDEGETPIYSGEVIGQYYKDNDGKYYELVPNPEPITDEESEDPRIKLRAEMSNICQSTIYSGIDVELSTGIEHFSLTQEDQINLFGKQVQLSQGVDRLEYHQDGHPCVYYSAIDMLKITTEAMKFVSYHTTYFNSLSTWIANATDEELPLIYYGVQIPEQYVSEVLADYLTAIAKESTSDESVSENVEESSI